jgi:hypothetical protein
MGADPGSGREDRDSSGPDSTSSPLRLLLPLLDLLGEGSLELGLDILASELLDDINF